LQQRPSAQNPLSHSDVLLQVKPGVFLVPQVSPAQAKGAQDVGVPAAQVPLPSQVFKVWLPPAHVEPQAVPLAMYWQAPAPSHMPVAPQVSVETVQAAWAIWSCGTERHCPSVCPFKAFVHAMHPVQLSWLQHTPSATNPDVHS